MPYVPKLNPRQKGFVAKFKRAGVKFFFKKMSKSTVTRVVEGNLGYQLEFPLGFIKKHCDEFTTHCTLVSKSRDRSSTKVWPLGVTVRKMEGLLRVFAFGNDGWKGFIADNNLRVDDLVVFQLVGFSRFRAYLWREDLIRHG